MLILLNSVIEGIRLKTVYHGNHEVMKKYIIVSEASSSSEINAPCLIFMYNYRKSGHLPREVPNVKWRQRANVIGY